MSKIVAWLTVLFVASLVLTASLGPSSLLSGQRSDGSQAAFVRAGVAAASTAPPPVATAIDQDPPAPTPTPTVDAAALTPIAPVARTVQVGSYNDASVVSGGMWSPDQNLGGWTNLGVGPRQGGMFRSYLRFVLSGLPPGIQVNSAVLILKPVDGGLRPVPIEADFVQDDWNESTVTWNQQPLSTYRAGAATWQPGSMGPFGIDVTPAVQQWYACGGSSNDGLELSADLAQSWANFGSRKSDAPPVLEVTYQTAVVPVNCSAPPTANIGSPPSVAAPSTSGALIGSINPNDINNLPVAYGTPYGALGIPRPPSPAGAVATNLVPTPVSNPLGTNLPSGPGGGVPAGGGGSSGTGTGGTGTGTGGTGP